MTRSKVSRTNNEDKGNELTVVVVVRGRPRESIVRSRQHWFDDILRYFILFYLQPENDAVGSKKRSNAARHH